MVRKKLTKRVFKEKTLKQLVAELDKVFSLYIRQRNADYRGVVQCFTSGKWMHWKEAHAGHFISRRHFATRWDEKNVQVQSVAENIFNQGNAPVFAANLTKKYGMGAVDLLLIKKHNRFSKNKFVLQLLIDEYKKKLAELQG